METLSALLALCAGNSPVNQRSFDVFFDLRLNKWLSEQWWGWWFETPSCPLWCHCNVTINLRRQVISKYDDADGEKLINSVRRCWIVSLANDITSGSYLYVITYLYFTVDNSAGVWRIFTTIDLSLYERNDTSGGKCICHDDVIKLKYFACPWPFVQGIHRWPVNFRTEKTVE